MGIIDAPAPQLENLKDQVKAFCQNLTSTNAQNKDVYTALIAHTKDSNEMALTLLTERKFLIQIIKTLSAQLVKLEDIKINNEEKVNKNQFKKTTGLTRHNTNSKLMYSSFIKDMRVLGDSKENDRLTRYKSHKHIDSDIVQASMNRCDSLSKLIVNLSKRCDREGGNEEEVRPPITKPNNLYFRRTDKNSFSFKYNSKDNYDIVGFIF